jgi:Protein of unknown function (DUF3035)
MRKLIILMGVALSAPLLTSCDTVRNGLGLDHYQPDEFAVPDNPPLSIPHDYKLRPPRPGAKPTNAVEANVKAQRAMGFEEKAAKAAEKSGPQSKAPEAQLVAKAEGNTKVTAEIREVVNRESEEDDLVSEEVMGKIRSWKKQATHNVNPANKPLNSNAKPTIQEAAASDDQTPPQQGVLKPVGTSKTDF